MDTKQYANEQTKNHWRNKKENKKLSSRPMELKTQHSKLKRNNQVEQRRKFIKRNPHINKIEK
jgi:hypothetical protein